MKRLLYLLIITVVFVGCKGEQGDVGPKGSTGEKGPKGDTGITGAQGANAVQPKIYDFNVDLSKALASYELKGKLDPLDITLVYINRGSSYAPLPFKGFANTIDKDFLKLDCTYENWDYFISFDNETVIPNGATFNFRLVVLRGVKGVRIKPGISWEELSRLYDLKKSI
jgi:hypothetical protein